MIESELISQNIIRCFQRIFYLHLKTESSFEMSLGVITWQHIISVPKIRILVVKPRRSLLDELIDLLGIQIIRCA